MSKDRNRGGVRGGRVQGRFVAPGSLFTFDTWSLTWPRLVMDSRIESAVAVSSVTPTREGYDDRCLIVFCRVWAGNDGKVDFRGWLAEVRNCLM
jgi:hypothetical protein